MERLVEEKGLLVSENGYEIQVKLGWYRSLPLSCVEGVQVVLDGLPVDAGRVRFGINGHEYRLDEMADLVEEFWFVQDPARLIVDQPGKVAKGEMHTVEAEVSMRAPYIPVGPGKFLVVVTQYAITKAAS